MAATETLTELAAWYATLRGCARGCCELPGGVPDELRLQALWQDSALRPSGLMLGDGTPVEVLEPGRWNRASGPDFRDALISIGGMVRRGDVELHVTPVDWDRHGHAGDPAYDGLILHVTWDDRPAAKTLPTGIPCLALKPFAEKNGGIDFTQISGEGNPFANRTGVPCLRRYADDAVGLVRLLSAAGAFRLHVKSRAYAEAVASGQAFQAFYEGLLAAMGYSRNTSTFRRLAREVPFARIASLSTEDRFAVLAGVCGLLSERHRILWDRWWRSGVQPPLEPYVFDLHGIRPANHPFRRLAGAVGVLSDIAGISECAPKELPDAIVKASGHLSNLLGIKGALIGRARAGALSSNLFVPYRIAVGRLSADSLATLPGEEISLPMRTVWHHLTGTLRRLPSDGLRQQGLLQIYADFCGNGAIACAVCPIADTIAR